MRIGLTGGIASGKSTVATMLEEAGVPVVDADAVAREVVQPGQPLFSQLVEAFGAGVLNSNGELDRAALGRLVFGHPDQLAKLNAMTHPVIWQEIVRQVLDLETRRPGGKVAVMVPLLLENQRQSLVDEVWVVSVPPELQKARLMARNQLTSSEADSRIAAQMPLSEKLKHAQVVIDNAGGVEHTRAQVAAALGRT